MTTQIDYAFSITPQAVNDGATLAYFLGKRFNTAHLVVPDTQTYAAEIAKLKAAKLNVIVDIEEPIWSGGKKEGTPISSFASYFQALKAAGVTLVASEGGRNGDLDYLQTARWFAGYVNYNCDQCGLWRGFHKHPLTVMNSWESYYTSEWQYIQQGIRESQGKKQGILAGVWEFGDDGVNYNPILTNSKSGNVEPNYFSMGHWMEATGGFDHFHVWGGLNSYMLARYKQLGFEAVVAKMQGIWPPRGTGPIPPTAKTLTTLTLSQSNATPKVDEEIAFTATLKAGPRPGSRTSLVGKKVTIWHYLDNVRYDDVSTLTDQNGVVEIGVSFKMKGLRQYFATFAGDDQYTEAGSGIINVV